VKTLRSETNFSFLILYAILRKPYVNESASIMRYTCTWGHLEATHRNSEGAEAAVSVAVAHADAAGPGSPSVRLHVILYSRTMTTVRHVQSTLCHLMV
jgi:hypothetical protein